MVLSAAEKADLWDLHTEALDDTVAYWPATDAVNAANAYKPAFAAKQGDYPCAVLDRAGFGETGGFFEQAPGETTRTLVLPRTAPRPKGMDRYYWTAESQWLEVTASTPAGTNGPVLYVTTREIAPDVEVGP